MKCCDGLPVDPQLEVSLEVRAGKRLVPSTPIHPDSGKVEVENVRVELQSRAETVKAAGNRADGFQPRDVVELRVHPDHVASRAHIIEV